MRYVAVSLILGLTTCMFAHGAAQDPSPSEQLIIYELNRARNNPVRFQQENSDVVKDDLSGVKPLGPLAVNNSLVGSASFHAEEMLANNYFAHQSAVTGDWPNKMARDNGYALTQTYGDFANNIESNAKLVNLPDPVLHMLRILIQDDGVSGKGHRVHLFALNPFFETHREIGVGIANETKTYLMSIHTAFANTSDLFLTGVVYSDNNKNGRYDLNEGLGGVTVSVGSASTTSNAAGGWSIPVTNGTYTVTTSGGTFSGTATRDVTVAGANVEIDFSSGQTVGELNFETQASSNGGTDTGSTSTDTDGDGFFDSIEVAAGTSASDISVTPFGSLPAGTAQTLPPAKLAIALNFVASDKDSIKLSGTLPVPDGFVYDQKPVIVDVGGVAKSFVLDAKGSAKPDKINQFKIGKPKLGIAKYSVKLNKGNFFTSFIDESLLNSEVKGVTRHVTVAIVFNNAVYQGNQAQLYTAKVNKTGKTKQPVQ
jgi:hypothetical protein